MIKMVQEPKSASVYTLPVLEVVDFSDESSVFTKDVWESGEHWTGEYDLDDPELPVAQ